ncbi:MAG: hypothetical protein E6J33_10860 [Chloroflexi bacterium]|nr:MAG: hypothetical protein E6J33_10860 [Chloroflexota bacterium]
MSLSITLIPTRMGHHQFEQLVFRLPFFKTSSIGANDQEVGGGYDELKPLTPVFKCRGLPALLLSIRIDHMKAVCHRSKYTQFLS